MRPTVVDAFEPASSISLASSIRYASTPPDARGLDEPVRVRRVARADHEQQVDLRQHLLDRPLPVGGCVADVLLLRRVDRRETAAESGDDLARLVDRERRLRHVRELCVIAESERRDVVHRLDEHDRARRLAHRPDDLLVPGVPDQHDRVAGGRVPPRLDVHLGHERARRVERVQAARDRVGLDRRGDAVRREDDRLALGHVALVIDEHCAAGLELPHDVEVVDDLLADVDRRSVEVERPLDRLDRPLDAGAVAARRRQEHLGDHVRIVALLAKMGRPAYSARRVAWVSVWPLGDANRGAASATPAVSDHEEPAVSSPRAAGSVVFGDVRSTGQAGDRPHQSGSLQRRPALPAGSRLRGRGGRDPALVLAAPLQGAPRRLGDHAGLPGRRGRRGDLRCPGAPRAAGGRRPRLALAARDRPGDRAGGAPAPPLARALVDGRRGRPDARGGRTRLGPRSRAGGGRGDLRGARARP